jgi:Ca-activated chloride channel family protein
MIGRLSFPNAWVVWLIPLLLLLVGLTLVEMRRRQTLLKAFGERPLMSRFSRLGPERARWLRPLLLPLALAGVTVALARPVLTTRSVGDGGRPVNLVVLLDVSRSMGAEDYAPKVSRLGKAKLMLLEALPDLAGRRVGVVTFAGAPFRQAPLTDDPGALKYILSNWVVIESAPPGGSDIAQGIRSATRLFEHEQGERIVLLFSDGGQDRSQDLRAALAEARSHGVRVFAFGLGGSIASKLPQYDRDGKFSGWLAVNGEIATTRLAEGVLEDIAAETGGAYSRVAIGQELKQTLNRLKIPRERSPAEPRELFQWPLAAALVLLFLERVGATLPGWRLLTRKDTRRADRGNKVVLRIVVSS